MAFVPFIDRKDGARYNCEHCLDYGGLIDLDTSDHDGLPLMVSCEMCPDILEKSLIDDSKHFLYDIISRC